MMHARTLLPIALAVVFLNVRITGQTPLQYRNFALGSSLASISSLTGMPASAATTTHQRPVLLQEMRWRPSRWLSGSRSASTDSVEQIVFSFYDDRLFRLVVDYRPERTAEMTDADLTEAVTAIFGVSLPRVPKDGRAPLQDATESGPPIARWAGPGHAVDLYRSSGYRRPFRLIVTSPALEKRAQQAAIEARRLDVQEAPQRELARQKKEQEDKRAAADRARTLNKEAFRP